ncbi:hypothetical protein C0J52_12367 [Blattella germanica]|nr:hypothetical protein C0J52_12367 [Blattella germanica]
MKLVDPRKTLESKVFHQRGHKLSKISSNNSNNVLIKTQSKCITPMSNNSTIHRLVCKVRKTRAFPDKKRNRKRTVLTEEKLDDIAACFEQSPHKSLSKLAQQGLYFITSPTPLSQSANLLPANGQLIALRNSTDLTNHLAILILDTHRKDCRMLCESQTTKGRYNMEEPPKFKDET